VKTHVSTPIIDVRGLSKQYQLGAIGIGSLKDEVEQLWSTLRGKRRRSPRELFWALRDVTFTVPRGEAFGIIGRNGAGKSTLLKILSRITRQTAGEVVLRGRVASLLEVGTGFHPDLSGRDNIFLNGSILGMTTAEIRRKFDEIVAFAGVGAFLDTPVKRYSSGMYVRLAFAVAAHLDPEILVVDEVLAVGDVEFQQKCLGKMRDVSRTGRTVLFVSHNMLAVRTLCSRALLLDHGRVTRIDRAPVVVDEYLRSAVGRRDGKTSWHDPSDAPGDERARLAAVRVVSNRGHDGEVDISKEFAIEVDYWNLQPRGKRLVSIHLTNASDVCVLTSGNTPSVCLKPDPWFSREYPVGRFRTTCHIPGNFLNDGEYRVSVFLNVRGAADNIAIVRDAVTFMVVDTGEMRKEYTGTWLGCVRPKLDWNTVELAPPTE
jgi:homopolymeric O-antigen transport system ATP-binding protein